MGHLRVALGVALAVLVPVGLAPARALADGPRFRFSANALAVNVAGAASWTTR